MGEYVKELEGLLKEASLDLREWVSSTRGRGYITHETESLINKIDKTIKKNKCP